jgi:sugar/nucleoside kinase (ribokinase family)
MLDSARRYGIKKDAFEDVGLARNEPIGASKLDHSLEDKGASDDNRRAFGIEARHMPTGLLVDRGKLLLHTAQSHGIRTSIDIVTETGDRTGRLAPPALKYADYCIINETEATGVTGVPLRTEDGALLTENMPLALQKMKELGVSTWAVIHCPEAGFGLDENNQFVTVPSLKLPEGYIKGSVGAGDAFCSGVLYAAWKGETLTSALELGTATAACSLSEPGSTEGVRTAVEARKLYESLR